METAAKGQGERFGEGGGAPFIAGSKLGWDGMGWDRMGWWKHQPRCRERERNHPRSLVGPRQVSRPWRVVLHPHAAARVGLPQGNAAPRTSCLPQTSSSFS